jgi:hypothetical protein
MLWNSLNLQLGLKRLPCIRHNAIVQECIGGFRSGIDRCGKEGNLKREKKEF